QRRRAASGDLAETVHRARAASPRLWERRPGHGDFLHLVVGEADVTWEPPLSGSVNASSAEVAAAVAAARRLFDAPVEVDLAEGGVVGIVGDAGAARAVARSLLLRAAVHHGPADVEVVVLGGGPGTADWSWARWLPHCRDRRAGGHLV